MIKGFTLRTVFFSLSVILLFNACRKREGLSQPDNYVVFESDAQGVAENENNIVIKVKLSRGTDKDIPLTINLTPQNAVYGTDFTTVPAATGGTLSLTIPSGNNEASFTVNKMAGVLYDGDEKI